MSTKNRSGAPTWRRRPNPKRRSQAASEWSSLRGYTIGRSRPFPWRFGQGDVPPPLPQVHTDARRRRKLCLAGSLNSEAGRHGVNLGGGRRSAVKLFLIPSDFAKRLFPPIAVSLKSERAIRSGNARKVDDANQEAATVTRKGAAQVRAHVLFSPRARTEVQFNGVGRLRTYISFTLVKARLWIVTTPSSTALCSAYMIGLPIYGIRRPGVGNLSSEPTILTLKTNCLRWRRSAMRSPITSKII
jgi:hypothetical protein